ncbi:hypothetical protein A1C_02990 [Rickettsia akari str. Hartford]|uniref:Uncharacterized protein n=1 Tax=Rickettsia akari (strain Hartford) TaxID=293614 RepID=A8GNB3_RICAH|nr:hypothetical protein A1C_02990 [Rickettsia akari str. Hartford]
MKKFEQHFKKQRNDNDIQVKKYKKDLDVIGIRYDHKFAHVEVPNYANGGFECFKWDWMTSTTGSHQEIVQIFKKIVRILKEAKNNTAQYENLVSNLDASTKNALDVNIKKHNITVPTPDTDKVISEILSGMQAWLDTKSHIPLELKQKFLALGSNNLEEFIESAFNKFNNKWIVKEFIDNAFVPPREESNKYLAGSGCDSVEQLWVKIGHLRISDDSNKATTSQASLDRISDDSNKATTSQASSDRISDDSNKATTSQASSESINSIEFKGNTPDEDSDDDIEVISPLLASKVTLNNGKKIDVKKIIDAIYNPLDLDFYLRQLTSEINQFVKKAVALKLAYDFYYDYKELNEVRSISEALGIKEEFNTYSNFSLEELKDEELNITGGDYSYLE